MNLWATSFAGAPVCRSPKIEASSSREYFNLSGEPVDADDVLGGSSPTLMADRRRLSAFGDILVPLGDALDVSFALRHDDFDDVRGERFRTG